MGKVCFVDVETTGLNPHCEEIIEIALTLAMYDRSTGAITAKLNQYAGLREPSVPIHRSATRIHGLKKSMLKGQCLDDESVLTLLAQADFFVAHNAPFDRGFLSKLYPQAAAKPWLCSMRGINWRAYGFPGRSLPTLLECHKISIPQTHRAEADVQGVIALLSHTSPGGKPYFYHLLQTLETLSQPV
ncbi:MAG: exonuclease domain-containing protein [Bacillota bacterium]